MRRGIQLPEFANLTALPAPNRGWGLVIGFGMGQALLDGPMANLSPIDFEAAKTKNLAGSKTIRSWRLAAQPFA